MRFVGVCVSLFFVVLCRVVGIRWFIEVIVLSILLGGMKFLSCVSVSCVVLMVWMVKKVLWFMYGIFMYLFIGLYISLMVFISVRLVVWMVVWGVFFSSLIIVVVVIVVFDLILV